MYDITGILADFVFRTGYDHLPCPCIDRAKQCFLDLIGVTLGGSTHPTAQIAARYVEAQQCGPQSTVIGRRCRTSPACAAFSNSVMGHILEYDDIKTKIGHPSVTIIPAILALAETLPATGKDILTAFTTGFEVSSKIAKGVEPDQSRNGWHSTSAIGVFGATAAAAKLLKLDAGQIRHAFGIAASFAGGLVRNFGTRCKPMQVGEAAEKGLKAALLSGMGVTADTSIFTGKWGYCRVFTGTCHESGMRNRLGDPFEVMENGFKFYPCCASAHTAIDAVCWLLDAHPIDPFAVESVEVGTVPINLDNLKYHTPKDPTEAMFSMQFCLATALLEKGVLPEHFTEARLEDAAVKHLIPKIRLFLDKEFSDLGYVGTENSIVTITLNDGRRYVKRVDIARGHPLNPLSEKELLWKYGRCAEPVLSDEAIRKSAEIIMHLEEQDRIGDLMDILYPNWTA